MTEWHVGDEIFVLKLGRCNGKPKKVEFLAKITAVYDRRAEYEGEGHKGGFSLDAPHIEKLTSIGTIARVHKLGGVA